jgi:hypothetical protein
MKVTNKCNVNSIITSLSFLLVIIISFFSSFTHAQRSTTTAPLASTGIKVSYPILADSRGATLLDLNNFDYLIDNFDTRNPGAFTFAWSIENQGTSKETLHGVIVLDSDAYVSESGRTGTVWGAIGLGETMMESDILFAYSTRPLAQNGTVGILEMESSGAYARPVSMTFVSFISFILHSTCCYMVAFSR